MVHGTYTYTVDFTFYQNGSIIYRANDMIIQGDSDAAYLVCAEAQSRAGGYIFLGNLKKTQFNGPVLVLAKIIKNVMGLAAEAEVGALYIVAQEIVPMQITLEELGHPQPATPFKTDNSTACGIMAEEQSKAKTVQCILGTGYQQLSRLPYKTPQWSTPQKGERYIPIRQGKESQYHPRVY
jgi:hypothetical protein